jgi:hypothetical protein
MMLMFLRKEYNFADIFRSSTCVAARAMGKSDGGDIAISSLVVSSIQRFNYIDCYVVDACPTIVHRGTTRPRDLHMRLQTALAQLTGGRGTWRG